VSLGERNGSLEPPGRAGSRAGAPALRLLSFQVFAPRPRTLVSLWTGAGGCIQAGSAPRKGRRKMPSSTLFPQLSCWAPMTWIGQLHRTQPG